MLPKALGAVVASLNIMIGEIQNPQTHLALDLLKASGYQIDLLRASYLAQKTPPRAHL